jgi:hypothetical protein
MSQNVPQMMIKELTVAVKRTHEWISLRKFAKWADENCTGCPEKALHCFECDTC